MLLYRPKLQIPLTRLDKILEIVALLLLVFIWVFSTVKYIRSPASIPIHFSIDGTPDKYGHKAFIFIMAGFSTIFYVLFTIMNRYPHKFNYLRTITAENVEEQYTRMTRLMRWAKVIVLAFLLFTLNMVLMMIQPGHPAFHGYLMLAVGIVAGVGTPIAVALYTAKPDKKNP